MSFPRPDAARWRDIAFFAAFLVYVGAGLNPRLVFHWQGPVFSTVPGFASQFLRYPGGAADYLYALIAQAYAFQWAGALVFTVQAAAVAGMTDLYFRAVAGRPIALVRYAPPLFLLYFFNLYYDHTPLALAALAGIAAAVVFARVSGRWRNEAALLGIFAALAGITYYLGGMALVFLAPGAAILRFSRRPRFPMWAAYLPLAAAMPWTVEALRLAEVAAPARTWFTGDFPRTALCWGLFAFFAVGTAFAVRRSRSTGARKIPVWRRRLAMAAATAAPVLALAGVAAAAFHYTGRDRRLIALDYEIAQANWPAVLDAAGHLAEGEFNSLSRYEINLALHETNRLGDEMFRYPQTGSMLLKFRVDSFVPYMLRLTDLCLRLGRVNEAERYGSEAMVLGHSDPRVYRIMSDVNLVKGQTAAARKFLNVLTFDPVSSAWAKRRLTELDQDPSLANDEYLAVLRRRMLRKDDAIQVWQRADQPEGDMERLLLDQLEQDPANRMAFEFLMGSYLLDRNLPAASALMAHIRDMSGPAYINPDGTRRTPRYFQEAMALYTAMSGNAIAAEGFHIDQQTMDRMAAFRQLMLQAPTREAGMQLAWNSFRDSYFFYATFGPGDYR